MLSIIIHESPEFKLATTPPCHTNAPQGNIYLSDMFKWLETFAETVCKTLSDFVYGKVLLPVDTKNGMVIGVRTICPENNFTLPIASALRGVADGKPPCR